MPPQGDHASLPEDQRFLMATSDIVKELIEKAIHKKQKINLNKLKTQISGKYKLARQPKLTDIRELVPEKYKSQLNKILTVKPVRTASGVAVVAVMCKPHRCPHIEFTGNICVYWIGFREN